MSMSISWSAPYHGRLNTEVLLNLASLSTANAFLPIKIFKNNDKTQISLRLNSLYESLMEV